MPWDWLQRLQKGQLVQPPAELMLSCCVPLTQGRRRWFNRWLDAGSVKSQGRLAQCGAYFLPCPHTQCNGTCDHLHVSPLAPAQWWTKDLAGAEPHLVVEQHDGVHELAEERGRRDAQVQPSSRKLQRMPQPRRVPRLLRSVTLPSAQLGQTCGARHVAAPPSDFFPLSIQTTSDT